MSKDIVFNSFIRGKYNNVDFNLKITILSQSSVLIEIYEVRDTEIANLFKFYSDVFKSIEFFKHLGMALLGMANNDDMNKIVDILDMLRNQVQFRKSRFYMNRLKVNKNGK
jgi:hypothetical protein